MPVTAAILHLAVRQSLHAGIAREEWRDAGGTYQVIRIGPAAASGLRPQAAPRGRLPLLRLAAGAVAAINGGYFDPRDGAPVSWVINQGRVISDPRQNVRLMQNPVLRPYRGAIAARTEWRALLAGGLWRWQLAPHGAPLPAGWTLWHALQAGPRLLPRPTARDEAFIRPGRDAINSGGHSARSGLGLTAAGDMLLVMSAARQTLAHFGTALAQLGCREAMALDGGSSSQLGWRDGQGWHVVAAGEAKAPERVPDLVSALVVGP